MSKKTIVVLGAGLGGLRVAQDLSKCFRKFPALQRDYEIFLVDKNKMHVLKADLYEVVAAFHKEITDSCLIRLGETVATPISKLIDENMVTFLNDEVTNIDLKSNVISLKQSGKLKFHYLAVCLGAVTNYFNIPGLQQFSQTMHSVSGAVKLSCYVDQFFYDLWKRKTVRPVCVSVGGGGAAGVETVGELVFALKKIAKKYHYPVGKISLQLIEGMDRLATLSKEQTSVILRRLRRLGVKVYLNSLIQKVEKDHFVVKTKSGKKKKIQSDIFIWTGGVMVNPVVSRMLVNPFLQTKNYRNVFAAGDNAFFSDPKNPGRRVPMLGQHACREGVIIANNIVNLIKEKPLETFVPYTSIMILPLGGKYAVLAFGNRIFSGFLPWVLKRLVSLKYMMSIMPFFKALKKWWSSNEVFAEND